MSLLLTIHDAGAQCWTQSDDAIPPDAALFPMQLSEQWTQNVHAPPKGNLVIHFVSGNFRSALNSDYFQDAPKCNTAFFDVSVLPLFAKGLWRFDLLQRLEPDDFKSAFGIQHFLLMLPGSQYLPLILERGLRLLDQYHGDALVQHRHGDEAMRVLDYGPELSCAALQDFLSVDLFRSGNPFG